MTSLLMATDWYCTLDDRDFRKRYVIMKLLSRISASLLRTSPFAENKLSFKKFHFRGFHFLSSFDLLVSVRECNV
jgi:hypothetical protein